jgi:hypothetical protein
VVKNPEMLAQRFTATQPAFPESNFPPTAHKNIPNGLFLMAQVQFDFSLCILSNFFHKFSFHILRAKCCMSLKMHINRHQQQ